MSEKTMRRRVVQALKPLHGMPVENPMRLGTPDVNCAAGWIELKWARRFTAPQKENESIFTIDHFTKGQRLWLTTRWSVGQSAWLLLQVGTEWFLYDGATAATHIGYCTVADLHKHAIGHWPKGLADREFIQCLLSSCGTSPRPLGWS